MLESQEILIHLAWVIKRGNRLSRVKIGRLERRAFAGFIITKKKKKKKKKSISLEDLTIREKNELNISR